MIYRIGMTVEGEHIGYRYAPSLAAASAIKAEERRAVGGAIDFTVEQAPTPTTKHDVVRLLVKWGSHNNNG